MDEIQVGEIYELEGLGGIEITAVDGDYVEFEEPDGSLTSMSQEEFLALMVREEEGDKSLTLPSPYAEEEPKGKLPLMVGEEYTNRYGQPIDDEPPFGGSTGEEGNSEEPSLGSSEQKTSEGFAFDSLESVRKKLIDLSNRNSLLNYRHPKASCLRIIDELPNQIVELLRSGKEFSFIPVPEPTEAELIQAGYVEVDPVTGHKEYDWPDAEEWARHIGLHTSYDLPERETEELGEQRHQDSSLQTLMYAPELEARCRSIRSKAETAIEESGANILYLVIGFLEWRESRDSDVVRRAPLFTLPVRMEKKGFDRGKSTFRYTIALKDDGLLTNIPLREKLVNDFGLKLPEIDEDVTPEDYFKNISQTILRSKPRWTVRRQATLALLNFSKQVMYEDLNPARWPEGASLEEHPIISQFFSSAGTEYCPADFGYSPEYPIDDLPDVHIQFPLVSEADSSQHSALIDALKGHNLVIEGPPGSGKSQTITNLIAASIANGKKVLFVAEKMAALEVVKDRMDKVGLGDFCLELHSHKTQKVKILSALESRINNSQSYRDFVEIEADIARFEDLKNKLKKYVEVANSPWRNAGLTIHEILNKATRYRLQLGIDPDRISIDGVSGENLTPVRQKELADNLEMFVFVHNQLSEQSATGEIEDHYWYGVRNSELLGPQVESLCALLRDWTDKLVALIEFWEEQAKAFSFPPEVRTTFVQIEEYINGLRELPELGGGEPLECLEGLSEVFDELKVFKADYLWIHEQIKSLRPNMKQRAIDDPLSAQKIEEALKTLSEIECLSDLTLGDLSTDYDLCEHLLEVAGKLAEGFLKITGNLPHALLPVFELSKSGIREFHTFVSFLAKLPAELWRNRAALYDDDDLDPLLEQLASKLKALTPLHKKLSEIYGLHRLPPFEGLEEDWNIFSSGGFLRIFSSKWRAAKKALLALAASSRVDKKDVLNLVPDLLEYIKGIDDISELNRTEPLLGDLYKGVDTPVDRILALRNWYREVREEYGRGFGDRVAIGDALLNLDRNLAMNILEFANSELGSLSDALLKGLKRLSGHFPACPGLGDGHGHLLGQGSPLMALQEKLKSALPVFSEAIESSDAKLSTIMSMHADLERLLERRGQWNRSSVKAIFDTADFELTVLTSGYSEEKVSLLSNLEAIIDVVSRVPILRSTILSSPTPSRYQTLKDSLSEIERRHRTCVEAERKFQDLGAVDAESWYGSDVKDLGGVLEKNLNASGNPSWLGTWLDYLRIRKRIAGKGLQKLIEGLEGKWFAPDQAGDVLQLCLCHQLSKEIFRENEFLADFSGVEQNAIRRKFRDYDRKLQELQQKKIAYRAADVAVPGGRATGRVANFSELALIRHEIGKKKKHIAIRSLLKRAPESILALKPCFMMSPVSVAQYLEPGKFQFDLVVMDEASQIRPEDALGSIARGKNLVVVGDPKQLPPTSFFQKVIDEEEENETVSLQVSESILDTVTPMFKNRRLRWHYRSRHESLIDFSNKHFYGSDLILFPSPFQESEDLGIRYRRVSKGRFNKRRNVEEAKRIVNDLVLQLVERPGESVGVVAMNTEQRDEIERQLDQALKDDDRARTYYEQNRGCEEPLFIKNLENVQGDERDVIFISMTYGPEQIGGRIMQRFGPINSDVGWRRLNVLFTRSKKRMHVYSSMTSGDILVGSESSRGVAALRAFLEYCETGHLHQTIHAGKAPDSDFEIAVMDALRQHGYECVPQLGVAGFYLDLAVRDPGKPGRFLMGIECDGATYHSAKSTRDRDRLRQEILEGLGWRIARIWSTDWFKNPQASLTPIIRQLEKLKSDVSPSVGFEEGELCTAQESGSHDESLENFAGEMLPSGGGESDLDLEKRLLDFHQSVIEKENPHIKPDQRLLRPAMLKSLLFHLPSSKGEFLELIPSSLRLGTAAEEGKFIGPVCEIIADYG
ncbi:DUF4011 domain-containing anti-phage protein Hhe [Geothermobacter hydrogeniphilus]|uniref:AAA domain-containing protein n=1 Tax=Geothermobacter hydrogeniphilus TaxID=1969733 RepID=A0A1X0Y568_9BACT|nr:DUF4011 domain-containing anti-phage protein Hhe [Geothermobacter hydrogeniphilus]ORJ60305.1 hypothetical protein B5V00_08625 [Geothermobacter hydrogeniphilus]